MIGFNDGIEVHVIWDRSDKESCKLQNVWITDEDRWMTIEEVNHYHTTFLNSNKALITKLGGNSHKLIDNYINSVVEFIIPDYDFEEPTNIETHPNPF